MKILGIETSCDETSASIVENGHKILSNVVASSSDMHAKTGGIIPEQAARQQLISIIPVITKALKQGINYYLQDSISGATIIPDIDLVAVTIGPGLIASLLVGIETAKTLSFLWDKPIVPVNHLVAHIYANWLLYIPSHDKYNKINSDKYLSHTTSFKSPEFPAIALVVSGGHTDLVLITGHGNIKWIGGTRDDAAGEAFDKCARLLNLAYPGGPAISKEADKYMKSPKYNMNNALNMFPRPMLGNKGYDFSFSGLKTSVLKKVEDIRRESEIDKETISILSAEIQEAIVDCLVSKSLRAVEEYKPNSFLLAGGVSANLLLRKKMSKEISNNFPAISFYSPHQSLCTDNAAYIASCAYYNYRPSNLEEIKAIPQLTIKDTK